MITHHTLPDGSFELKTADEINLPRNRVFDFFSNAANLQLITPGFLDFKIITPLPVEMKEGALIDYSIKLHGLPLKWRTKITRWEPGTCFVDSQLKGPYTFWHHTHTFTSTQSGTRIEDRVHYKCLGGKLVRDIFVKKNLQKIFEYRQNKIKEVLK